MSKFVGVDMRDALLSPLDALRLMVEHYPHGGRPAIAQRLGISDDHLRKQLAGATTHKMGVVDACIIAEMCAAANSMHAEAYATAVAACSGGYVDLHMPETPAQMCAQRQVGDVIRETAEVAEAAIANLADDRVSPNERRKFSRQVADAIGALQRLQAAMVAKSRRGQVRP